MRIVREPENVDFTVINRELSEKEQEKVSEYIRKDKQKRVAREQAVTDSNQQDSGTRC
jgi:CRISPR/Cas system CSM-associated protein Csm5 (group 7 of RAMP superfamily)